MPQERPDASLRCDSSTSASASVAFDASRTRVCATITTTQATVDLLKKHGFSPVFKETPGGHTWINWRNYLNEFVPQLFQ